ncbi:putative carboxypeptidase KEX1 precursor [Melampsora larici-populina 98AG31]|uniref:Carboxypeptidase n=1 Tax=Melampsora larici-populina (strain 98AG31 / pathotype 3-4-7) TaxID=747676 RepID=F4RXQ8_MELLP|nr:putative carboxypeptidase KEX1 precursor [Melampsora larici-populina 98AG31]EGG02856.1 putative carboxypeptidase KEX1 precursor [Melampsora larici-populina 98AG31]
MSNSIPFVPLSTADFYINSLPGQESDITQYSGHISSQPITTTSEITSTTSTSSSTSQSHLWFWFIRPNHIPNRQKLVIWFNGGPGCSSLEGGLMEIGPLRVSKKSSKLTNSQWSWSQYANLLFIDQPAGTGYSFAGGGETIRELDQAANQVVSFLERFFKLFPELSNLDTYLAGESYAGQFIPYIAQAIKSTTSVSSNLKGLLMGNAWINPQAQYPTYIEFAYERGMIVKGSKEAKPAEAAWQRCQSVLESHDQVLISECEDMLQPILDGASKKINGVEMKPVAYNITESRAVGDEDWPDVVKPVTKYLNRPETIEAFHAKHKPGHWKQCNDTITRDMWSPNSKPSYKLLPNLLKEMKVLLYAGDQDFMCNTMGIDRSIQALTWDGQTGWSQESETKDYFVNGRKIGTWREERGLSLVVFDKASHLVPMDEPIGTQDMLLRFLEIDKLDLVGPARSTWSQMGDGPTMEIVSKTFENGTLITNATGVVESEGKSEKGIENIAELERVREAYYGPRRTLTLVFFLFGIIIGVVGVVKWRARKRIKSHITGEDNSGGIRLKDFELGDSVDDDHDDDDPEGGAPVKDLELAEEGCQLLQRGGLASNQVRKSIDDERVRREHEVFGIGEDD